MELSPVEAIFSNWSYRVVKVNQVQRSFLQRFFSPLLLRTFVEVGKLLSAVSFLILYFEFVFWVCEAEPPAATVIASAMEAILRLKLRLIIFHSQ